MTDAARPLFTAEEAHKRLREPVVYAGVCARRMIRPFQCWDAVGDPHASSNGVVGNIIKFCLTIAQDWCPICMETLCVITDFTTVQTVTVWGFMTYRGISKYELLRPEYLDLFKQGV